MEQAGLHASFTLIPTIVYGFNIIIVLFTNSKINDLTVKACYPIIQGYRIGASYQSVWPQSHIKPWPIENCL